MTDKTADMTPPQVSHTYRAALGALRPALWAAGGISAAISVLMLTGSIYMLQVYDRVLSSGSVPTLLGLFAIVAVLYSFLGFYDFLRLRLLGRLAVRFDRSLGPAAFAASLRQQGSGQLLRDIEALRGFLAGPVMPGLFDLPWVPLYLAVLFLIHPWFGWLTMAGALLAAGLALATHLLTKDSIRQAQGLDAEARDFAERSRQEAGTLIAMGMETASNQRWRRLHEHTLAATQAGANPTESLAAGSRALRMLLQSAMLTLGAWLVIVGEISGGMIIASSILSGRALAPVDQLIGQWRGIGHALAAHRRLDSFFGAQAKPPQRIALPAPTGQIAINGVTKHAGAGRPSILQDVSFTLAPGDGLGVIGASASGKSTLARLLVGALTPDEGEIRLDGARFDQWEPDVLGRHIGYLPQSVALLPGTIRDNIARFDASLPDHEVIAAATLTGVHEMILRLPDGYATMIGNGLMPLSGGQIQRLGLARAICGMPKLVVLDEPNSNLDAAGDAALTRTLTALRATGSAVVVMAHRASALAALNKVMVLRDGRVADFGDKDVLLPAASMKAPSLTPAPVIQLAPVSAPIPLPIRRVPGVAGKSLPRARALRKEGL